MRGYESRNRIHWTDLSEFLFLEVFFWTCFISQGFVARCISNFIQMSYDLKKVLCYMSLLNKRKNRAELKRLWKLPVLKYPKARLFKATNLPNEKSKKHISYHNWSSKIMKLSCLRALEKLSGIINYWKISFNFNFDFKVRQFFFFIFQIQRPFKS